MDPGAPLGPGGPSTSTCIALVSGWACWTWGPVAPLGPVGGLVSTRSFITLLSSWAHGSFRSMIAWWSRSTCWSRGSRVSWDAWNSCCTETSSLATKPIWWRLLRSALNEERTNESFGYRSISLFGAIIPTQVELSLFCMYRTLCQRLDSVHNKHSS